MVVMACLTLVNGQAGNNIDQLCDVLHKQPRLQLQPIN